MRLEDLEDLERTSEDARTSLAPVRVDSNGKRTLRKHSTIVSGSRNFRLPDLFVGSISKELNEDRGSFLMLRLSSIKLERHKYQSRLRLCSKFFSID